ncbi:MAG: redoxin domain-containing protein [Candidatus Omnitrophica bacterium]|nr:redoxin domain-containing protein [Candidatus Omnitrophota bacterium]
MFRARLIFIVSFFVASFVLSAAYPANGSLTGSIAPPFKVISGEKEILTLDDIKGKVAVLFYEAKSTVEQNRKLKTSLNAFYDEQSGPVKKDIIRIGVINCQGVLFRSEWEKNLRHNSEKEGLTLYGDWDGNMSVDYHAKEDESNVIIIDKKGIIRYYASGRVEDKDIGIIEDLLKNLVKEN